MRQDWIDILRGIGIFCVLLAHSSLGFLDVHISSFFIPIFFFISGYLFNPTKYTNFKTLAANKTRSILIPYFLFSFFLLLIFSIQSLLNNFDSESFKVIGTQFIGIIYSRYYFWHDNSEVLNAIGNAPFWFLTSLFVLEISYYWINKVKKFKYLLMACISLLGILINQHLDFYLPWSIDIAMISLVFFETGRKISKVQFKKKDICYIMIIFLILNLLGAYLNGVVNLSLGTINNPFLFYINATTGVIFYAFLSKYIKKQKN